MQVSFPIVNYCNLFYFIKFVRGVKSKEFVYTSYTSFLKIRASFQNFERCPEANFLPHTTNSGIFRRHVGYLNGPPYDFICQIQTALMMIGRCEKATCPQLFHRLIHRPEWPLLVFHSYGRMNERSARPRTANFLKKRADVRASEMSTKGQEGVADELYAPISQSRYILAKYRIQVVDVERSEGLETLDGVRDDVESSHNYHSGPKALGK